MPLFTDINPLNDQTKNASDRAGIATIRAIQEAFYGLEAYESSVVPLPEVTITRLRVAGVLFERAAPLYRSLGEIVPEQSLNVSEDASKIIEAAFDFRRRMGGIALREHFAEDWQKQVLVNPISSRILIAFAAAAMERWLAA